MPLHFEIIDAILKTENETTEAITDRAQPLVDDYYYYYNYEEDKDDLDVAESLPVPQAIIASSNDVDGSSERLLGKDVNIGNYSEREYFVYLFM